EAVHRFSKCRRLEREQHPAADFDLDEQSVPGQRLASDNVAQLEGKPLEGRKATGLQVEMAEVEAPAGALSAAMLAHEPIEPAVEPARQRKVIAVDGEYEGLVEDRQIEPVGDDQLDDDGT